MNNYDLNIILTNGLNETQLQAEKDAIAQQVERNGGEIVSLDEWGTRRLAYPINKMNEGYYLIYRLQLSGEAPNAIEAVLKQRDNVMRVLAVKDRPEWRTRKVAPAKAEAAQETETPAA